MIKYIFKKKQYSNTHQLTGLKRHLNLSNLVFFGIASIIGGGSFSTIGQASAHGGPAVIFLFFIIALLCCLVAFSYAELSSKFPLSGSAYTYSYIIFGEIVAWLVGWTLIVEYTVGNIVVAISFSEYLVSILHSIKIEVLGIDGIYIPKWLSSNYFDVLSNYKQAEALTLNGAITNISTKLQADWELYKTAPRLFSMPIIINLPALFVTLFVSFFAYIGINVSNKANNIMVAIKFASVAIIVIAGSFYVKVDNWEPFMPYNFNNMLSGLSAIFFGYVGFDAISMVSEEAKNPRRDISRALIISLILCAFIYIVIALTITGIVPYNELDIANPLAYVFSKVNNKPLVLIVSIGVLVSMMNALMAFQVAQPRLLMNMSRDKLLPKQLALVHSKYRTPYVSTILVALMVALPASITSFNFAIDLTSLGALFVFMIVCLAAIKLRLGEKVYSHNTGFRIPFIDSKYFVLLATCLCIVYLLLYKKVELINFITNKSLVKDKATVLSGLTSKDISKLQILFNTKDFYSVLSQVDVSQKQLLIDNNIECSKVYMSALETFLINIPQWLFIIAIAVSIYVVIKYRISLLPLIGFLFCFYFAAKLSINTWLGFVVWILIGVSLYFVYSYKRSNR